MHCSVSGCFHFHFEALIPPESAQQGLKQRIQISSLSSTFSLFISTGFSCLFVVASLPSLSGISNSLWKRNTVERRSLTFSMYVIKILVNISVSIYSAKYFTTQGQMMNVRKSIWTQTEKQNTKSLKTGLIANFYKSEKVKHVVLLEQIPWMASNFPVHR